MALVLGSVKSQVKDEAKKSLAIGAGAGWGCLLLALLLAFTPFGFILIPFGQIGLSSCNKVQLSWNRAHYEEVVREIDRSFPDPIRMTSREVQRTRVHFERQHDGRLIVIFPYVDWGHAGNWYKFYSNPPMNEREVDDWVTPGRATRVDDHWWAVDGSD